MENTTIINKLTYNCKPTVAPPCTYKGTGFKMTSQQNLRWALFKAFLTTAATMLAIWLPFQRQKALGKSTATSSAWVKLPAGNYRQETVQPNPRLVLAPSGCPLHQMPRGNSCSGWSCHNISDIPAHPVIKSLQRRERD